MLSNDTVYPNDCCENDNISPNICFFLPQMWLIAIIYSSSLRQNYEIPNHSEPFGNFIFS